MTPRKKFDRRKKKGEPLLRHHVINIIRLLAGLNINQLARRARLGRQFVSTYLNRGVGGTNGSVAKLARALKVNVSLIEYIVDPDDFHRVFTGISSAQMMLEIIRIYQRIERDRERRKRRLRERRIGRKKRQALVEKRRVGQQIMVRLRARKTFGTRR